LSIMIVFINILPKTIELNSQVNQLIIIENNRLKNFNLRLIELHKL